MNLLVTGASGLVGSAVVKLLGLAGHQVAALRRTSERSIGPPPCWNPDAKWIDLSNAGPLDVVVHLAGESIAQRWTRAAMKRIRDSRVNATHFLAAALARLPNPPRVMVCASAVGAYGDRGDEELDESSALGTGFLAEVCREWEAATEPLRSSGTRVVHLRLGVVLSPEGGALPQMLPAFWLGLGGKLGSGRQFWSWIVLEDLVGVVQHALAADALSGPVNAVAPNPVTNLDFTATLGRILRRPTFCTAPAWAVKFLLGAMGQQTLLSSARVRPRKLLESGFAFRLPELEPALRNLLAK